MNSKNKSKYGKKVSLIYLVNLRLNKLLFYLRDNINIPERNKWSIFGGVIENGETKENALERELKEEISIPVSGIEYIGRMTNPKNQKLYFFRGKIYEDNAENIRITEGQRVAYFNPDDIFGTDKFETSVEEFYRKNKEKILK